MKPLTVAIAGNPNSGKTTLFNLLTGSRQKVGNWPGVTVEKKTGTCNISGEVVNIVDLPGIYSFSAASPDEQIARDFLLSENADVVVNILDATSLERGLFLSMQLLEMGIPVIVVANMMDQVKELNLQLDIEGLSHELNCPVLQMTASKQQGLEELKLLLGEVSREPTTSVNPVQWPQAIQQVLPQVSALIEKEQTINLRNEHSRNWMSLYLLESDQHIPSPEYFSTTAISELNNLRKQVASELGEDLDLVLTDLRYGRVREITGKTLNRTREVSRTLTDRLDTLVLNRFLAIPIFLLFMYLTFMVTINVGGAFIFLIS